jgi:hypothetical protein
VTHSVEVNTPLEALWVEQALAMGRELGSVAAAGPRRRTRPTGGRGRGGSAVPRGVGSVGPFHALEHAAAAAKGRWTTWWVTSPSTPSDWRSLRPAARAVHRQRAGRRAGAANGRSPQDARTGLAGGPPRPDGHADQPRANERMARPLQTIRQLNCRNRKLHPVFSIAVRLQARPRLTVAHVMIEPIPDEAIHLALILRQPMIAAFKEDKTERLFTFIQRGNHCQSFRRIDAPVSAAVKE